MLSLALSSNQRTATAAAAVTLGPGLTVDNKEYMQWRVRRNQKRIARLDGAAIMIQRAYRAHIARTLSRRVMNHKGSLTIQRWWRGCLARGVLRELRAQDWAARLLQRNWRGHSARVLIWTMFLQRQAAVRIQRCWRGFLARAWITLLRQARNAAAAKIQSAFKVYRWVPRSASASASSLSSSSSLPMSLLQVLLSLLLSLSLSLPTRFL